MIVSPLSAPDTSANILVSFDQSLPDSRKPTSFMIAVYSFEVLKIRGPNGVLII